MLIRETTFTVDLGENGYLIGFDDDYDFPSEMPFGWRCGPATPATAVVLPTTDTGTLRMTVQLHDSPPDAERGDGWEPAEEMSLLADTPTLCVATIGQGDFWDAWPEEEPPLEASAKGDGWVRMRLYCHVDDAEPGTGDRGERHLIQFWPAPQTPPVHPDISEADRQARAAYAADMANPVEDYTYTYGDQEI
ncbi:hypothetical protein GTY41_19790 [Streptomyces sp. SID685]|uniref:hypothetical protein n=1 Tax=Streptomyces sp. SID685 TaxID=2690322 RepID=UPI00136BB732|nr:hypothetical protein [Streptomyces sp. SID685]MYR87125.1 hypothetical protein [Streptomyces sp. SID685]